MEDIIKEKAEEVDLFSFPDGYNKAKELLEGVPEPVKDMLLYGLGRTVI